MANKDMTVPKVYKGKKTMEMTGPEYEKMLKELGMDKPSKTAKKGDFNEEPDMGSSKYAKGGMSKKKKPMAAKKGAPAIVIAIGMAKKAPAKKKAVKK
jgi:hypothetical protein